MGLFSFFNKKKNAPEPLTTPPSQSQVMRKKQPHVVHTVQKEVENIVRRARGTQIPMQAQRVFFSCDARNTRDRDMLIADLLSMDAGMDCVVSYFEIPGANIDEELLRNELHDTQTLVLWVTVELLQSIAVGNWPVEFRIAQELHTPILPIAKDGGLFPRFTELAGAIHGIAMSDAEYRAKLKAQMETFLASEEVIKQIQEKAFTAKVFLSYRKMDISEARRFMKVLHNLTEFEAVSIWYDNFLTAGRNFNYEIEESITKSDAFVLLVTPNLATEGNYVQTTEYPFARQKDKPVVSVETKPTDAIRFAAFFPGTDRAVPLNDSDALRSAFHDKLGGAACLEQLDNERAYLLGMAFLKGFGVERDYDRARRLLEAASKVCSLPAWRAASQLAEIYRLGIGSNINHDKALCWWERTIAHCEHLFGLKHPNTAAAYNMVASVHGNQGNYRKALELHQKVLAIYEKTFGKNHPDTARSYQNIAADFFLQGDISKALKWYRKATELLKETLGAEHPDTARAYHNIAGIYATQGDYAGALGLYHKALAIYKKTLGRNHFEAVATYNNIAALYRMQCQYPQALTWFKDALTINEKALGIDHPDTAKICNNIAEIYYKQKEYSEALKWWQKAIGIYEKIAWGAHPDAAVIYCNIAAVYQMQGDYPKALAWFQKDLEISEKILSMEHPDAVTTYNNIASVYLNQRDYSSALEWHWKALNFCMRSLGANHPLTKDTLGYARRVFAVKGDIGKDYSLWLQKKMKAAGL